MNSNSIPAEIEMLPAVLRLFPKSRYRRLSEASLGRKRIDLICLPRDVSGSGEIIAVELKIARWRDALWQAYLNLQAADCSYIAIWTEFVHRALAHEDMCRAHGVGLIEVGEKSAKILFKSEDRIYRVSRESKRDFYCALTQEL